MERVVIPRKELVGLWEGMDDGQFRFLQFHFSKIESDLFLFLKYFL